MEERIAQQLWQLCRNSQTDSWGWVDDWEDVEDKEEWYKQAQAILTAVAESLPERKTTMSELKNIEFLPEDDEEAPASNNDFKAHGLTWKVQGWNAYRNEVLAQLGKEVEGDHNDNE